MLGARRRPVIAASVANSDLAMPLFGGRLIKPKRREAVFETANQELNPRSCKTS
jgi:hypothetical protein